MCGSNVSRVRIAFKQSSGDILTVILLNVFNICKYLVRELILASDKCRY